MKLWKTAKRTSVITCKHILSGQAEPKFIYVDEPIDASDSGWQVLCELGHHEDDARIVSWKSLITISPSIAGLSHLKPGDVAVRNDETGEWDIQTTPTFSNDERP